MQDHRQEGTSKLVSRRTALTMGALGVGAVGAGFAAKTFLDDAQPTSAAAQAAAGAPAQSAAPSCVLAPETTEGPYYLDLDKVRSDISEGKPGLPLALQITVLGATSCAPLSDVAVDIWHCDSGGLYSGYTATDPDVPFGGGAQGGAAPGGPAPSGAPGTPPSIHVPNTDNLTFLRGVQVTDKAGVSRFTTIYPGWYAGRTVHVHVKVGVGGNVVHTGQLFFPDAITDEVYKSEPYAARAARRDTRNADDRHYNNGGVNQTFTLTRDGDGYLAAITVGVKNS